MKGRWNQRAFVATGALLFGLTLPVTGLVDHVVRDHEGAAAVGRWSVAHIALSVLFVVFCVWHVVLNRRALARYLRAKTQRRALPAGEPGRSAVPPLPRRQVFLCRRLHGQRHLVHGNGGDSGARGHAGFLRRGRASTGIHREGH